MKTANREAAVVAFKDVIKGMIIVRTLLGVNNLMVTTSPFSSSEILDVIDCFKCSGYGVQDMNDHILINW